MTTPQELNELADGLEALMDTSKHATYGDGLLKQAAHELRHIAQLQSQADQLHRELVTHREKAQGNYWGWDPKAENHVESLVCPILIHPHDMLAILNEAESLRADLHEAAKLLSQAKDRWLMPSNWHARRDSFLAKISTVSPETKTTKER